MQYVSNGIRCHTAITPCNACGEGKQTTESLKRELEKEREQTRYWKACYETALKELSECDHSRQ